MANCITEITKKLHENRVIETKKLKESTATYVDDVIQYLKDMTPESNSWLESYDDPENYGLDAAYFETVEELLGDRVKNLILVDTEDDGGVYEGDANYSSIYRVLADIVRSNSTSVKNDADPKYPFPYSYTDKSKFGKVLRAGGYGYEHMIMSKKTRDNLVKYIKDHTEEVNNKISDLED